jgi:hypothetical protein
MDTSKTEIINQLLQQLQSQVDCGTDCQRANQEADLQKAYDDAKRNLATAPEELSLAAKNYYTFEGGEDRYNQFVRDNYAKEVDKQVAVFQAYFDAKTAELDTLNETQRTLDDTTENSMELLLQRLRENRDVTYKNESSIKKLFTSDRKSYYANENLEHLQKWNHRFLWLYHTLVWILVILLFALPYVSGYQLGFAAALTWWTKCLLLGALLLFPSLSMLLLGWAGRAWKVVVGYLQQNGWIS